MALAHAPGHGVHGDTAGEAVVDGAAEGIFIGPGADAATAAVLLHRGEAVLDDRFRGLVQLLLRVGILHGPDRTEIQDLGAAGGVQDDIVGADVPVDEAGLMDGVQGIDHVLQHLQGLLGLQAAAPHLDHLHELRALDEFHDDVGGIVLPEAAVDAHDLGDLGQLRQGPGLPEEPLPAGLEGGYHVGGVDLHILAHIHITVHRGAGEELLDRHQPFQVQVPA